MEMLIEIEGTSAAAELLSSPISPPLTPVITYSMWKRRNYMEATTMHFSSQSGVGGPACIGCIFVR